MNELLNDTHSCREYQGSQRVVVAVPFLNTVSHFLNHKCSLMYNNKQHHSSLRFCFSDLAEHV